MPPRMNDSDGRVRLAYERRLDEIERLWLMNPSKPDLVAYLQGRLPDPGCGTCGAGGRGTCQHGPYRWPSPEKPDRPISLRMIEYALAAVQQRLRARARADREENRALFIARQDDLWRRALRDGNLGLAYSAACRRADVDGTHVAAEEATAPTLFDEVLQMAAQLVDYTYTPGQGPPSAPATPEAARFELLRAKHLLIQSSDGAKRYRELGDPQGKPEADRLAWRRSALDEVLYQILMNPAASPEQKRSAIIAGAGTASMITEGADMAERLAEVLARLGKPS